MLLLANMRKVLATTFTLSLKTQQFHWNVMGPDFPQYHTLFGNMYEEIYGSVDQTAEIIRTLGAFPPASLQEFLEEALITDEESTALGALVMMQLLIDDNEIMIHVLKTAYESAELEQEYDVSDFLAGRLTAHKKHAWMLHSILGQQRTP
jgi:starvation-inducible DNA-binding protein